MQQGENIKKEDELDSLMAELSNQAAEPNPEYAAELEAAFNQAVDYTKQVSAAGPSMWNFLSNKALGGILLFSVLAVFVGVFLLRPVDTTIVPTQALPDEEAKQVLTEIFANNPQTLIEVAKLPTEQVVPTSNTTSSTTTSREREYEAAKKFNYSYVRNKVELGAAQAKCAQFEGLTAAEFEQYQYLDKEVTLTKTATYDKDRELVDYYLVTEEGVLHYKGGEFAALVKSPSTEVISSTSASSAAASSATTSLAAMVPETIAESTSSTLDAAAVADLAVDFFGEGVIVSLEKDNSGQEIYVLQAKKSIECDISVASATQSEDASIDLVSILKIEKQSFKVISEERYLGSVTSANLLRRLLIEQETETIDKKEVAEIFEFEYDAPVLIFPREDGVSVEDYTNLISELKIPLILPDAASIELTEISSVLLEDLTAKSYLGAPSFYASQQDLVKLLKFSSGVDEQVQQGQYLLSLAFKSRGNIEQSFSFQVEIYQTEVGVNDLTAKVGSDLNVEGEKFDLTVDGNKVDATRFSGEQETALVFRFNGLTYLLKVSDVDVVGALRLLNISDRSDASLINALLQTVLPTLAELATEDREASAE